MTSDLVPSNSHQNTIELEQKQKYRPVKQDRNSSINLHIYMLHTSHAVDATMGPGFHLALLSSSSMFQKAYNTFQAFHTFTQIFVLFYIVL